MSSNKEQGPLLYIQQPFVRIPQNFHMQEVYTSRQKKTQTEDVPIEAEAIEPDQVMELEQMMEPQQGMEPEQVIELEQVMEPEQVTEPERVESPVSIELSNHERPDQTQMTQSFAKRRSSLNKVKPFKEMSLTERIDYLLDFPKVLPPVQCVFYTNSAKYLGVLTGYEENQVVILVPNQTDTITIPVKELKNIIMIGIRR
ncbi:CotO family spore coat protein [Neobacillus dielmonensis]|uniref:CotO family spore coat protein n=1 Tax=Neobacillus dielmonensis TaxID=1347369 RepID=UPI0005A79078|nr:CotO family spore coat protein [Neobacillus dielmonensis]